MTPAEAITLCRMVKALCPQQAFDSYTPDAWALVLADVRLQDAKDAAVAVARRQPFVAPSEIIAEVKRIRGERIARHGELVPPEDLDPDNTEAYASWLRDARQAIGDGVDPPPVPELAKRDMRAIAAVTRRPE
jgi:hypothetical protein